MRILVISPFPIAMNRGNSVAAARLARGFADCGHDVRVVDAVAERGAEREGLRSVLQAAGPVHVALVLHAAHGAAAARILAEQGVSYVVSLRGTDANELLADPMRGAAARAALDGAARVAVFHAAMREALVAQAPAIAARVRLVANGLSLPVSNVDYRARLGIPAEALVFLSLAGLRDVKRPTFPIENLAPLVHALPRLRFVRAGPSLESGPTESLRRLVAVHPWVVDASEIPHDTVDSFLRMGDVFVSASRSEGMPHAVREAMLTGRASLLSDIPGHRAMATPEREVLFFSDAASFQAAALRLGRDGELRQRIGAAARERVASELAAGDEVGQYLALLEESVAEAQARLSGCSR